MDTSLSKPRMTPSDFFLQLGIIVALYASSVSLVSLLFEMINKLFPDKLDFNYYFDRQAVLMATAVVIIFFPLYLILGWLYGRGVKASPEKLNIGIRRWLVYLTLFLAGLALAIDLVTLVYYFLGGEITVRFIMKVLVVLVVAGMIFSYYLYDIRKGHGENDRVKKIYSWVAIVLVIAAIISSFIVFGSPVSQRKIKFDERRIMNLQNIQWQIITFWQQKQKLPQSLEELRDPIANFSIPTDPETNMPYEYQATGKISFKLCATFSLSSQNDGRSPSYAMPAGNDSWTHDAGKVCFDRTIDPELYPPRAKTQFKD